MTDLETAGVLRPEASTLELNQEVGGDISANRAENSTLGPEVENAFSELSLDDFLLLVTKRYVAEVERVAYPYRQSLVPLNDDETPHRQETPTSVQCRDLSRHGFSFLSGERPRYPKFVIELGVWPHCIHVLARVVNCSEETLDQRTYFRIGCEFIQRTKLAK